MASFSSCHSALRAETRRDLKQATRHPLWYFADGNCIFLVDNILFNLHRFILTSHSAVFRALFELPPPNQRGIHGKRTTFGEISIVEGTDDKHPIALSGVVVSDFEAFLTILYLPVYETDPGLSLDQWVSILELSSRWDFASIRMHAISKLELTPSDTLNPILRLSLALKYDLSGRSWLVRPLTSIVTRKEPLTCQDASILGLNMTVLIARAREEVRSVFEVDEEWCNYCERCGKTSLLEEDDVEEVIMEVFGFTAAEISQPEQV
ncbi:hypothetical protein FRC20_001119 [Serendipita sp. 405]|nr:hypothetical protein FRC20_001119 [Serendipita sp. 405]